MYDFIKLHIYNSRPAHAAWQIRHPKGISQICQINFVEPSAADAGVEFGQATQICRSIFESAMHLTWL